jgi:hypothetical protein
MKIIESCSTREQVDFIFNHIFSKKKILIYNFQVNSLNRRTWDLEVIKNITFYVDFAYCGGKHKKSAN